MKIKVMPYLSKQGNRVGKAALSFDDESDGALRGFQLVGFTICDDPIKGMFVLFPSSVIKRGDEPAKPYFFLRPSKDGLLNDLQDAILDIYDSMTSFNNPRSAAVLSETK